MPSFPLVSGQDIQGKGLLGLPGENNRPKLLQLSIDRTTIGAAK